MKASSRTPLIDRSEKAYEARKIVPSTRVTAEEARVFRKSVLRMAREGRAARKDSRPLDDRDLYGEDGLPKDRRSAD